MYKIETSGYIFFKNKRIYNSVEVKKSQASFQIIQVLFEGHCVFYGVMGLESWSGVIEWILGVEPWSGTLE